MRLMLKIMASGLAGGLAGMVVMSIFRGERGIPSVVAGWGTTIGVQYLCLSALGVKG